MTNPLYGNVTTAGVIPSATMKTGTISSYRTTINGTDTLFLTEVNTSDFIYSQNQVREVTSIISDTELEINAAFSGDLPDATDFFLVDGTVNERQSISNIGATTAYIGTRDYDAQPLVIGGYIKYNSTALGPITYDPNGGTLIVSNGEFNILNLNAGVIPSTVTSEEGIVAFAGGGQASATQLTAQVNRVDTVVTAGDSVRLPTAIKNMEVLVQNFGADTMDVFPSIGDNFLNQAINIAYPVGPGNELSLFCYANGTWTIK